MIMAIASTQLASVRYLVDDVDRAVDFYTTYLGFTLGHPAAPAFAEVVSGPRRLVASGPMSEADALQIALRLKALADRQPGHHPWT